MSVTSIDLFPNTFEILTSETLPITIEWVDLIGNNAISTPSAVMIDQSNSIVIPEGFQNNYGANGTQSQYIFQGPFLQAGHKYIAIFSVMVGTQTFKARLFVNVPR